MNQDQLISALAAIALKNDGPNGVEIYNAVIGSISAIATVALTTLLVRNDSKRLRHERRDQAFSMAHSFFTEIAKNGGDEYRVAVALAKQFPTDLFAILRGYELATKGGAFSLLVALKRDDHLHAWPTPQGWDYFKKTGKIQKGE